MVIGPLFCWDSELCVQPELLSQREGNVSRGLGRCFCTALYSQEHSQLHKTLQVKSVYGLVARSLISETEEIYHTLALGVLTSMLTLCSSSD